jgi:hypothetical protein
MLDPLNLHSAFARRYESLSVPSMAMSDVVYTSTTKVSVRAGESAMIPLMSHNMRGDKILLYDAKEDETNVATGVHLVNDTGVYLCTGDMSIFEEGRFVGQYQWLPMLAGDDQIVNYGIASSVDVTRTKPRLSSPKDDEVVKVEFMVNDEGLKTGVRVWRKSVLDTKYKLVNNDDKGVERLYVDHSAYAHNNGYTITTSANAVKRTTGFTRFEFALAADEERDFVVSEEAIYTDTLYLKAALVEFSRKVVPGLVANSVVAQAWVEQLQRFIDYKTIREALQAIKNGKSNVEHVRSGGGDRAKRGSGGHMNLAGTSASELWGPRAKGFTGGGSPPDKDRAMNARSWL